MPRATATNEFFFDFMWEDPDNGSLWLYKGGCWDYATFKSYPEVVMCNGLRYMKSAFNSDTGKMAYRQVTLFDMVAKGV